MEQKNLFGLPDSQAKRQVSKVKNYKRVILEENSDTIPMQERGLNSIWKNFGEWLASGGRDNKTINDELPSSS